MAIPPILVDATVQDPAPATISNTATVSGGGSADASASDGGGASGLADISITKAADVSAVSSGDTVTYTLNVLERGSVVGAECDRRRSDRSGARTATSRRPPTTQGSCDATVSCSLGTVTANSTVTITITATVIARDTTLTNGASVSSSTPDPKPFEQHRLGERHGAGHRRPRDRQGRSPANPTQGGADTFTLTVSNNGPDAAHSVVVNDALPSQFTAATASGGGFTCTIAGRTRAGRSSARSPPWPRPAARRRRSRSPARSRRTRPGSPRSTRRPSARTRAIRTCLTTPTPSTSSIGPVADVCDHQGRVPERRYDARDQPARRWRHVHLSADRHQRRARAPPPDVAVSDTLPAGMTLDRTGARGLHLARHRELSRAPSARSPPPERRSSPST